jgi:hypothetical protein
MKEEKRRDRKKPPAFFWKKESGAKKTSICANTEAAGHPSSPPTPQHFHSET